MGWGQSFSSIHTGNEISGLNGFSPEAHDAFRNKFITL